MFIDKLISTVPQVTADNPLAAAHQIRQLTERGERPTVDTWRMGS